MASLPYNIATNVTYQGILSATAAFQDVAVGKRNMALVCSDPGFGKTLLAKRTLRNNGVPFHEFGITPSEHDLVGSCGRSPVARSNTRAAGSPSQSLTIRMESLGALAF